MDGVVLGNFQVPSSAWGVVDVSFDEMDSFLERQVEPSESHSSKEIAALKHAGAARHAPAIDAESLPRKAAEPFKKSLFGSRWVRISDGFFVDRTWEYLIA